MSRDKIRKTLIIACDENDAIGETDRLPWYIPEDLRFFRQVTTNNTVLMGRKTYQSIPDARRPLSNRMNVIFTRDPDFKINLSNVCIENEISLLPRKIIGNELFIIGGAEIYKYFLDYHFDEIDRILLTRIYHKFPTANIFVDLSKVYKNMTQIKPITSTTTSSSGLIFQIFEFTRPIISK